MVCIKQEVEGVKLKEPEEYSLDYCGIAKFTQESLLSCDLLKRLVLPAQPESTAKAPRASHAYWNAKPAYLYNRLL